MSLVERMSAIGRRDQLEQYVEVRTVDSYSQQSDDFFLLSLVCVSH